MIRGAREWWRGCVIYQIYPRSFCDSNGDGIGDLAGITARLDHVADLGVDAVWLSPFLESPQDDFGYDVSSYRAVDPMFGTMEDLEALLDRAHELGLKVIMDHVLSHTSEQHPWFQDSRQSRDSDRANWYVWADPRPDGTPPNNWLAVFGGSAWQWEPRRQQYYLHNFLTSQPDLNFHEPAVRAQLLEEVEFWLQKGVDGFRLDAVNFYVHDPELRDNPVWPADQPRTDTVPRSNPYAYQRHLYDKTRPENIEFLRELRRVLNRYPGAVAIGEIMTEYAPEVMGQYTSGGDTLHMAYTFDLLGEQHSVAYIRGVIENVQASIGDGWPCWSLSNHDVIRVATRWGNGDAGSPELAKVLMAMLLSLSGSVCVYQGEELGLPQAEVPYDRLQDPYGRTFWPEYKGRDGCRTPMPWTADAPHAGFSTVEPWLPIPQEHRARAVSEQEADPTSVLHAYRRFLRWRRATPALRFGDIEFVDAAEPVVAFVRTHEDERVLAAFNLGAEPVQFTVAAGLGSEPMTGHGAAQGTTTRTADGTADVIELSGHGVYFGRSRINSTEQRGDRA